MTAHVENFNSSGYTYFVLTEQLRNYYIRLANTNAMFNLTYTTEEAVYKRAYALATPEFRDYVHYHREIVVNFGRRIDYLVPSDLVTLLITMRQLDSGYYTNQLPRRVVNQWPRMSETARSIVALTSSIGPIQRFRHEHTGIVYEYDHQKRTITLGFTCSEIHVNTAQYVIELPNSIEA